MVQVPYAPRKVIPLPPDPSDDLLVERALDGDQRAFAALVERHRPAVGALAKRLLRHPADVEDAAQETFVRAFMRLGSYRPGSNFRAWLLAIVAHYCIDQLRRQRPLPLLDSHDAAAGADGPETLALRAERRREVRRQMADLPEHYRRVLELRYWQDLSYAEVGDALGEPSSTVRMRLFRAHRMLRAGMAGE